MIDTLLSLIGMGQSQSHRSADRFAIASSHLANIEKVCLEADVQLKYEVPRLSRLAEERGVPPEEAIGPLLQMAQQKEKLRELVATNRELLQKKGANAQVVAEVERWAGTCSVIPKQIELTVRQIEEVLRTV
ncbi:MAG: hypothetical protein AAFS01_00490 [Pseudomonadota bacterium]